MINNRVALLVDNEQLYNGLKRGNHFDENSKIEYSELVDYAVDDRTVVMSKIFCSIKHNSDPTNFFYKLNQCGFEVFSKSHQHTTELGCDFHTEIVIQAMELIDRVDTIILVVSDARYQPLVDYIRSRGRSVELHGWIPFTPKRLQQSASRWFPLGCEIISSFDA